ncbi:MAG: phosphoribosylanthranilate isomerase [Thermodesulfobacteriota bacterium]|nr:phosphoribosylanthranilate isomerase [Thermodesulfobacteriota bacterium]
MVRVKVCGITNLEDALAAVRLGADALGFVFAPSPRRVTPKQAKEIINKLPPLVCTVGVFVNSPVQEILKIKELCGLDRVQLHGDETPGQAGQLGRGVIKALSVRPGSAPPADAYPSATLLLDTHVPGARGGTGQTFDWNLIKPLSRSRPIILAGGLNPKNVTQAVAGVKPYAVDVSSGVESIPGRKDHDKIARFIKRAKGVD